jgi:hypothetical protein
LNGVLVAHPQEARRRRFRRHVPLIGANKQVVSSAPSWRGATPASTLGISRFRISRAAALTIPLGHFGDVGSFGLRNATTSNTHQQGPTYG